MRTTHPPVAPIEPRTPPVSAAQNPHLPLSAQSPNAAARTLAFLVFLLFLNLQGDGFHLGGAYPLAFQFRLLPLTVIALLLFTATLFPKALAVHLPPKLAAHLTGWRTPLAAATLLLALACPLFLAAPRLYSRFGYQLRPQLTFAVFAATILALAARLIARKVPSPRSLALLLAAILSAITLLSLRSFPLAVGRSDMLPLLAAANHSLLHHADPYRLYTFPSDTVLLTYLPGTVLAYLPATALRLDLRLTNLAALLLLIVLVLRLTRPAQRLRALALLACFLLGPYLLYRHEIYTAPHWLTLAAALLLAHRGHLRSAAALFGCSIAMSQFSWILLPFFLIFLFHARGARPALQALAVSLLVAALFTLPFLAANPHTFLACVFGHWQRIGLTARPVNLSFFAASLLGPRHLVLAQLAVLLALFVAAVRTRACRTFAGTLAVMSVALFAFVLLNLLVWGYFFLLVELLLLLFLLAAEDTFLPAASHQ